jgi:hypothetical protein
MTKTVKELVDFGRFRPDAAEQAARRGGALAALTYSRLQLSASCQLGQTPLLGAQASLPGERAPARSHLDRRSEQFARSRAHARQDACAPGDSTPVTSNRKCLYLREDQGENSPCMFSIFCEDVEQSVLKMYRNLTDGKEANSIWEPREGRHNFCRPSRGSTI